MPNYSKNKIFIHLGFPKTGTTYLQNKVFPSITKAKYLGKPFDQNIAVLEKKILLLNDNKYNQEEREIERAKKSIKKYFKKRNLYIISHEGFIRSTRYNLKLKPNRNNIYKTIDVLNKIFSNYGEVNFIIVIRKYDEILKSYFEQFHRGFEFQYDLDEFKKDIRNNSRDNILKNFFYGSIAEYLRKSRLRYKILLYEDLKYNPNFFHSQLFKFMNINIKYKNEIFNSSKDKYEYNLIKFYIKRIIFLSKLIIHHINEKTLLKKIIKVSSYTQLIRFFYPPAKLLRKFFKEKKFFDKYKTKIHNFYYTDFKKLPKNIKIRCEKYNYLKSN